MKIKEHSEFLTLLEPIHKSLSRYCRAISGNIADAEDLMNDTILNTLENFHKIKDMSAFRSYIFSIASNLHKKKLRRLKFKAEFNSSEINCIHDISQDPEYITDFRIIYNKILQLPKKMSEAIILFHISDLSIEDIQKIQGGSISGVKLRLKRGREKLLSMLETPRQVKVAVMFLTI